MRSRLSRLERCRQLASLGVRQILMTVSRSSPLDSGLECNEQDDCVYTDFESIETHCLRLDQPGSQL